ncbi:MAG: hypothetical protein JST90_19610 [Bacteroidetes bacterium]|nr:hypothetical protein [Bacteroidota bacterium]
MRCRLLLLVLFATFCATAQHDTSYATIRYNSVAIYRYNKGAHEQGMTDSFRKYLKDMVDKYQK